MELFDLKNWLKDLQTKIQEEFDGDLLFMGYQGSYRRNEAEASSDIDIVVILNSLTLEDLKKYKQIVQNMPYKEKCCGFICGKDEIANWSKSDIFQFYYETENLFGNIKDIITPPTAADIKITIKTGVETLYHMACHSFLYDKNPQESLIHLYKMPFFILQAKYFLILNKYIPTKKELLNYVKDKDRIILETCITRKHIQNSDNRRIEELYELLILWCSKNM